MWEDESFDGFDEATREHFRFLKNSLGHNFNSILNDPNESSVAAAADWGSWIGNGVMQLFDKSAATPAMQTDEQVMASLSHIAPVTKAHVASYISLVSQYEGLLTKQNFTTPSESLAVSDVINDVPPELFDVAFDPHRSRAVESHIPYLTMRAEFSYQNLRKLQSWLKSIEDMLLQHVQHKSKEFFAALQEFREIASQMDMLLEKLRTVKERLHLMQRTTVEDSVIVRQTFLQRDKLQQVSAILNDIATAREAPQLIQSLLNGAQYNEAVHVYQNGTTLLNTTLVGIVCVSNLKVEFAEIKSNIVLILTHDLQRCLAVNAADDVTSSTLEALVKCLVALDSITEPVMTYRSGLAQQLSAKINEVMVATLKSLEITPAGLESADGTKGSAAAPPETNILTTLQRLKTAQFVTLIQNVFRAAEQWLTPTLAVLGLMVSTIKSARVSASAGQVMQLQGVVDSLQETHPTLFTLVQSKVAKIFEARSEENTGLRFIDMENLLRISFGFVRKVEAIHAASCLPGSSPATTTTSSAIPSSNQFRAILINQARTFFKKQHEKQKQKIAMVIAQEQWSPEPQVESIFQRMVTAMIENSPAAIEFALLRNVETTSSFTPTQLQTPEEQFITKVTVGNRGYTVTNSILILMQALSEYEKCLCAMPFLGNDIIQCMHDLLRLFMSQCVAMILGGGALTNGLETITASHLALGTQCIDFLASVSGAISARLTNILPPKMCVFLKTFEKFEKDAKTVRNEFYLKIISMVMERVDTLGVPDAATWKQGKGNQWILNILKELTRVMKNLKPVLDRVGMKMVLCPIVHQCNFRIRLCISKMHELAQLSADPGLKQAVWEDIVLYKLNLEKFGLSVMQGVQCTTLLVTEAEALAADRPADVEKDIRDYFFPA